MAGHGFDIVSRTQWGARPARSRVTQNARSVDTLYIHWPGATGSLRGIDTRTEEKRWMRDTQAFHQNARTGRIVADPARGILLPCGGDDGFARSEDERGWSDFAYSYALFLSGRVYAGRTFKVVPASQAPDNTNTVSVCCVMGAADAISDAMKETLREFVRWAEKYAHRELDVQAHRDVNQTSCPGDKLAAYVPRLDRI
jgi:hypothetical protein